MDYLNDDCIMEIVERLDLGSLCAFRKTSTKLRRMAIQCFKRKYSHALIEISEYDDGINVHSNYDHGKCFRQYIKNVYTLKWPLPNEEYSQVGYFIQANIITLKQIVIRRINFNDNFGIHIAHLLKNVESVSFMDIEYQKLHKSVTFIENILKHCQQLKRLKIDSPSDLRYLSTKKYATLEHFDFIFYENDDLSYHKTTIECLKDFFYLNPNIKELKWRFGRRPQGFTNEDIKEHVASYLKSFMDCAKNLDTLYVEIPNFADATKIFNALIGFNECENIKKMEIKLIHSNVQHYQTIDLKRLSVLNKLTGLYVSHDFERFINNLHSLNNLKILKFYRQHVDAVNWSQKLPNLEELYIYELPKAAPPLHAQKGLFFPFVRYLPKLKKIVTDSIIGDDGLLFNYERQNLKDACVLEIYMCATRENNYADEYVTFYYWIESPLVKFKLVKYEDFYDADFVKIKNQMYPVYKKFFYK